MTDGWIEWHGGENPAPGQMVTVRFEIGGYADKVSDDLRWTYDRGGYDIIAYRVVTPARAAPVEDGLVGELVEALRSTRDGLQAMADEGIIAQGSWPTIDAALARAEAAAVSRDEAGDMREKVAAIISPSLFRMIPRGKKRPRGEGETTGKYRHADREEFRERARAKADAILALTRNAGPIQSPEEVALADMREIAVGLGYESILEALENLERLKTAPNQTDRGAGE